MKETDTHLDGLSTRIAKYMQIPTRTVNESVVRQKPVFCASSGEYLLRSSLGLQQTKNLSEASLCETSPKGEAHDLQNSTKHRVRGAESNGKGMRFVR